MNFWTQLASKQKPEIETLLAKKLGQPNNELNNNLFQEILKKITAYYFSDPEPANYTTYTLFGLVNEISQKKFKEGKHKGQTYYVLKLGGTNHREALHAKQENLPPDKWKQITKSALLGQNLVFKYKKWITNKQLLDFYPQAKTK